MKKNDLLKYLQFVRQLEIERYTQQRAINGLKEKVRYYGRKDRITQNTSSSATNEVMPGIQIALMVSVFVIPIVWIVNIFIYCNSQGGSPLRNFFTAPVKVVQYAVIRDALVTFLILLIPVFIEFICNFIRDRKANHKYKIEYEQNLKKDASRVSRELVILKKTNHSIQELERIKAKNESMLRQLYAKNIIYKKYQNLIAVCSFCEYLQSGRADQLEGHEGAYNIFESEARLGRIITNQEIIIKKLDDIRDTQYLCYDAMKQIKGKVSYLMNGQEQVNRANQNIINNQAVLACSQKQIRQEVEFNTLMQIWK